MGRIARWIDSRSEEERDRIIEHPDPTFCGSWWWDKQRDCGCLIGCVLGRPEKGEHWKYRWGRPTPRSAANVDAGERFPELTERFTPERMWRVAKARAAKGNRVEVRALAATPTEAKA